jgi:putative ABC transport system permease protein
MGVARTMLTLVLERRRIGDAPTGRRDRGQVRRMVLIEAAVISAVGQGLGIASGSCSLVLIYVINVQSFGWTIQFHLPVSFLVQSTALVMVATAFSGIIPARLATRLEPVEEVGEE